MADTRFVTDGRTDGVILICQPKFLWGYKVSSLLGTLLHFVVDSKQ